MALQPQSNAQHRSRTPPCPVCFQRHPVYHCWSRGLDHQPTWLQRNAAKYNALNNDKALVTESYKNQAPPLRFSTVTAQANKSVHFIDVPPSSSSPVSNSSVPETISRADTVYPGDLPHDDTSVLSIHEQHASVTHPTCNMADVNSNMPFQDQESFIEA